MDAHENCGVAAVWLKKDLSSYPVGGAAHYLYRMLLQLQNRGQLSTGIATFNENNKKKLRVYKGVGLVNEVFKVSDTSKYYKLLNDYSSTRAIGHVRYATSGSNDSISLLDEAQPFLRTHGKPWKTFAIAYNGTVANFAELKVLLNKKHGYEFSTDVDTELMMHLLSVEIKKAAVVMDESEFIKPDMVNVFNNTYKKFDGSWSVVMINGEGDLYIFRDPFGFRPLCYGENDDLFAVASESVALTKIGIKNINHVMPGDVVSVEGNNLFVRNYLPAKKKSLCMFEYVYFSDASSNIDNILVHTVRENLGVNLAKEDPLRKKFDKSCIVVPVPNTSITAAHAMAKHLGLDFVMGLSKKESLGRSFIEKEEKRDLIINNKYVIIGDIFKGKKIILVDDSIVRGSTSCELVNYLKDVGGAKEVHFRSTCPPIRFPCFYGIDFPTLKELIAFDKDIKGISETIGADSLYYLSIEGLVKAIGHGNLCLACLNGKYPTIWGKKNFLLVKKIVRKL